MVTSRVRQDSRIIQTINTGFAFNTESDPTAEIDTGTDTN